jgi:hypothetical protein
MWVGSTETGPGGYGTAHDSASASFSFSSGDTLWVGYYGVGSGLWIHDDGAGVTDQCRRSAWAGSAPSVGDSWSAGTGDWAYTFSSYINYTPDAGGDSPQRRRRMLVGGGR